MSDRAAIPDDSPVPAVTIIAVEDSWAKVETLGAETVGVLLFKSIFEIAPEALALFSFKGEKASPQPRPNCPCCPPLNGSSRLWCAHAVGGNLPPRAALSQIKC